MLNRHRFSCLESLYYTQSLKWFRTNIFCYFKDTTCLRGTTTFELAKDNCNTIRSHQRQKPHVLSIIFHYKPLLQHTRKELRTNSTAICQQGQQFNLITCTSFHITKDKHVYMYLQCTYIFNNSLSSDGDTLSIISRLCKQKILSL